MKIKYLLVLVVLALSLSSCYWNEQVNANQQALQIEAGAIKYCVGPGVYSGGFYADLVQISTDTLTFSVEDPEVATRDSQLVGITISIQARRKSDCQSLTNMLTNWSSLIDDEALQNTVAATANEGIKIGTRQFTLEELLNDRNGLAEDIQQALEADTAKYSVEIINVTVKNVALNAEYAAVLNQKSLLTAQIETALRQQDLIKQQAENDKLEQDQRAAVLEARLTAEQAQTQVEVEIARRQGEVTAQQNAVYEQNPKAYELERLRLAAKILNNGDKVYFVKDLNDLILTMSGDSQVIPVTQSPDTQTP